MKLHKITALCLLLLILGACETDLDQFPPDTISDPSFWKTSEDFRLAANDFYLTIPTRRTNDLDSDLQRAIGSNNVSQGVNLAPENDGTYNGAYNRIRVNNKLLEQAELNTEIDVSRFVAEARFFRALNYFNLVRRYGDVALITKVLTTASEELSNSIRTPREEVIDFCINDLQQAILDLPLRSEMPAAELGRITKGAAQTLLAKIALFEGTWSKYNGGNKVTERLQIAADAAWDVISSNEYALYNKQGDDSFRQFFWNPDADDESIGEKPEKILSRRYYVDLDTHNSSTNNQGLSATKKAVDMFVCTDGLPISISPLFEGYGTFTSEFQNRDLRMWQSIVKDGDVVWNNNGAINVDASSNYENLNPTGYRTWKSNGDGPDRAENREVNDLEMLRYAEVLLIFAEATYENNGDITDEDLNASINLLRARGQVAPLTNALVNGNGLDMLQEIRRERTVELMFEGERLEDLKRWGIAVEEMTQPMLGIQWDNSDFSSVPNLSLSLFSSSNSTDSDGFVIVEEASDRLFSEKNYLFPLPLTELLLTGWEQNDNW